MGSRGPKVRLWVSFPSLKRSSDPTWIQRLLSRVEHRTGMYCPSPEFGSTIQEHIDVEVPRAYQKMRDPLGLVSEG